MARSLRGIGLTGGQTAAPIARQMIEDALQ
jgi:hypothetical protein